MQLNKRIHATHAPTHRYDPVFTHARTRTHNTQLTVHQTGLCPFPILLLRAFGIDTSRLTPPDREVTMGWAEPVSSLIWGRVRDSDSRWCSYISYWERSPASTADCSSRPGVVSLWSTSATCTWGEQGEIGLWFKQVQYAKINRIVDEYNVGSG